MSDGPPLAASLITALNALRASVADAEQASAKSNVLPSTRDDVVELALIRAMGMFEEFIGDLFMLGLQDRLGPEVAPVFPVATREEAALLVGGADTSEESRYLAWMPYKTRTLPRAKRLFENGQPFSRLGYHGADAATLRDLVLVRNRVAHDSPSARAKFRELAIQKGYPSTRAADYLTSVRGTDSEILLALTNLGAIARGLAEPTETGSRTHMSQEEPFRADELAPPGSYECQRGSHALTSQGYSVLGDCAQCPRPSRCPHCGRVERVQTSWIRTG